MAIEKELLDQHLAGRDPKELFAKNGLLDDLKKALSERILNAELDAPNRPFNQAAQSPNLSDDGHHPVTGSLFHADSQVLSVLWTCQPRRVFLSNTARYRAAKKWRIL